MKRKLDEEAASVQAGGPSQKRPRSGGGEASDSICGMSGVKGDSGQEPELTALAKRYTHPTGEDHKVVAHTGKSGLTPVKPQDPAGPFPSRSQKRYIKVLEAYQEYRTDGFNTQRLMELEAFAPLYNWYIEVMEVGGVDFDARHVPIHPFFARQKWDKHAWMHLGRVPIGKGRTGFWDVRFLLDSI